MDGTKLLEVIAQIPICVRAITLQHIQESGCADFKCMCRNDNLLTKLMYDLLRSCKPPDQNKGFEIAQELCRETIPSLDDSKGTEIVSIVAVMTLVSTIAVILRLIGRRISAAPYGIDDLLIIIALFLTYGLNINEIIAVHYGFGKHQLMLSLDHIKQFLLNDWTIQILFATAISITRMSLLVFYHRLFPVRRFTIVAVVTGCIMIGWWISFIFAIMFSCVPVSSYWNKAIEGHCLNEHTLSWGITGSELGANIIMLILPIPWLWDLRLDLRKKLALIGIFMLGCFVCISCIVRFPLLAALVQTDASWTLVPAGIWIVVECNIGIASVCLPLMRPLVTFEFSHRVGTFLSFSRSRRTGSPCSDEEGKTENSSGLRSIAKLCDKPYDGPCLESRDYLNQHHPYYKSQQRHPHSSDLQLHSLSGRYDVHTHRSRIESYSPDTSQSDSLKAQLPPNPKQLRSSAPAAPRNATGPPPPPKTTMSRSSAPPNSKSAKPIMPSQSKSLRSHQLQTAKGMHLSVPPVPKPAPAVPPPPQSKVSRSSAPPHPTHLQPNDHRRTTPRFNPLQAHPPSIRKSPRQSSPRHRSHYDPLKARPSSIHKPKSPRHRSAPIALPNQTKPPRHVSAPLPAPTSAYNPYRRKERRFTADEMNERWRMWHQGRGSEVGKGLWSLEIVAPQKARKGVKGIEVPWEIGEEAGGSETGKRGGSLPKSRLE